MTGAPEILRLLADPPLDSAGGLQTYVGAGVGFCVTLRYFLLPAPGEPAGRYPSKRVVCQI